MALKAFKVTASRPMLERTDGKKGKLDSVDVQLSVTVNVPRGKKLAREVIIEAIRFWCAHNRNPRGFKIKIIRWRNPDRSGDDSPDKVYTNPEDAELQPGWRMYGSQAERRKTLGRALRGRRMAFTVTSDRAGRGNKSRKKAISGRGQNRSRRRV